MNQSHIQSTAQPTAQPQSVALEPRIAEKKNGKTGNFIMLIIAFSLFSLICWWVLFPAGFQQFISNTSNQIDLFKARPSKSLPDLSSSAQLSDQTEPIEQSEAIQKTDDQAKKQKNTDIKKQLPMNDDQIGKPNQEKITPYQDQSESLHNKKKNPEPIVQNDFTQEQNNKDLSEDMPEQSDVPVTPVDSMQITKYNPLDQNLETKKKILPLPEKAIIIRFQYNTNDFTQEGYKKTKEFADIIAMHPDVSILISGYTDSNGNAQYNQKLSEFRANIVRSFLLGRGVMVKQIEVKGLGSLNPMESNSTAWGRMMNRRVEIEIVK
ncbi:MAG: OmpA family protein [Desulfobacula sp.]|nr:OmpA family protein [Desulfobacula sp.]